MFYDVFLGVWNIPFMAVITSLAVMYVYFIKHHTNLNLFHKQPILFFICLGIVTLTIGSPLASFSHLSFSLHMIQMSVHYFIVPPLILLGIPSQLYQYLSKISLMKRIRKICLSPKLALISFAVLFLLYHLPVVLSIFPHHPFIHIGYTSLLFALSFRMWWPITTPDLKQRISKQQKKHFASLSGLLLMPACLLFIFNALIAEINNPFLSQVTTQLCSPSQTTSINLFPFPFNTKYDQFMAGVFMLGLHKIGIVLSLSLQNNMKN